MDLWVTPDQYQPGTISNAPLVKRERGNPGTRKLKRKYRDLIVAFDIETTGLPDIEQSVMYVWQLCIYGHQIIVGRTWEELRALLDQFRAELGEETALVIWVHNLSYEFQFLRAIYDWQNDEVFAVKSRRVLKSTMFDGAIEFRCSYLHSNMGLDLYCKKMRVEHGKLSGDDYDYKKLRYPWTPLTEREMQYCINDVIGLCECIKTEMEIDGDTLATIPLTSTGYVRRDARQVVQHNDVADILPDLDLYHILRDAFRGGDTHANRYYAGRILRNVKSADESSCYPAVMCNGRYPITPFKKFENPAERDFCRALANGKAVVFRALFRGVRLRDDTWGFPYLAMHKCGSIRGGAYDNGRVLSCEYCTVALTDIDYEIVAREYVWDDMDLLEMWTSDYGALPPGLIDVVIQYYVSKTELKGVPGREIEYGKSKNKLNSNYGMMAQNPVKQSILFDSGSWSEDTLPELEILEKHNKKAFLCYQWGVWVTANARRALREGLYIVGHDGVYCDTDSVKYVGDHDFTDYNNRVVEQSTRSGAYATDPAGNVHYMGVYEPDGEYAEFRTWGAKKYAYTETPGGETHVTVAGVNKQKGGKELDKYGGLKAFVPEFVFREAGGTESVYNDDPAIKSIEVDGHPLEIKPNIYIKDSTYTMSLEKEYAELLRFGQLPIDNSAFI